MVASEDCVRKHVMEYEYGFERTNHIGNANLVLGCEALNVSSNVRKTFVLTTRKLAGKDQASITTTLVPLSSVPCYELLALHLGWTKDAPTSTIVED